MNPLIIIMIIILLVSGIILYYGIKKLSQANKIEVQKVHQQHQEDLLNQKISGLTLKIEQLKAVEKEKNKEIENLDLKVRLKRQAVQQDYTVEKKILDNQLEDFKKTTQQAASHYFNTLEKDYVSAQRAHKQHLANLQAEYNQAAADLQVLKDTRKAAFEALLKLL